MRAFISGHIDLSQAQFSQHYAEKIDNAIAAGHSFVVGNAYGCDAMALQYLKEKKVPPKKVTVYHRESAYDKVEKEHLTISEVKALGYTQIVTGWNSFTARDAAMTKNSDYDIAWVRPDSETKLLMEALGKVYSATRISGTQKNINRRAEVARKNERGKQR